MTRYLIPSILLALIAALFITLRPESSNSDAHQANGQRQSPHTSTESTNTATAVGNVSRTKSKVRIQHPKPSIEETEELLENTLIPKVEFEDQTVLETTIALNIFIKEAGIPTHKLRVITNESGRGAQLRVRELKLHNVSIAEVLRDLCGSTTIRYRVEPGIVRVLHITEIINDSPEIEKSDAPSESYSDPNDPFAESPIQLPDPFAEPDSSVPEADPFAEPTSPTPPDSH